MRLPIGSVTLLCCCAVPFMAQTPYPYSVTNSASYRSDAIAQGSLFVVFGSGLGPSPLQQVDGFPLPSELAGTSIRITVGSVTVAAPMVYTSAGQVAAILPSTVPEGQATLRLSYKGTNSYSLPIQVVRSAFGTYAVGSRGIGAGVITDPQYRLKTYSAPAKPGDTLIIWGTGLGPVEGNEASGPLPGNNFTDVEVYVGNNRAPLRYAGRSGCCAGLDQIAFDVPDTSMGCFVPVAVRSGGRTSNFVSLPVSADGSACAEPIGIPADVRARTAAGEAVGLGMLGIGPVQILQGVGYSESSAVARRLSSLLQTAVPESEVRRLLRSTGSAKALLLRQFAKKYAARLRSSPAKLRAALLTAVSIDELGASAAFTQVRDVGSVAEVFPGFWPPPGTCTVLDSNLVSEPAGSGHAQARDAGAQLSVAGPIGSRLMQKVEDGLYQVSFGSGFGDTRMPRGEYTMTGTGGRDVGAFTARVQATTTLQWTNRVETLWVDRRQPLTIRWTGDVGYVLLGGVGGGMAFSCVEDARKGSFTVPVHVLAALPALGSSEGYLFLFPHPFVNRVTVPGLDLIYFADFSGDWKEIDYR